MLHAAVLYFEENLVKHVLTDAFVDNIGQLCCKNILSVVTSVTSATVSVREKQDIPKVDISPSLADL